MPCLAMETPNIHTDQSALLAFKSHVTSDPLQFLTKNWTVGSFVCDWIGVTCGTRHLRVRALNISYMNLVGTISPHLGNLSFLVYLSLGYNSFRGSLPHELANLRRLNFLSVGNNKLSGAVPTWIGSLSRLRYLSLASNEFSGLIPSSLSNLSKLEILFLSNNSLEGIVPAEIGNLYHLKELAIERNSLSGSLPPEIFNISTLQVIGFVNNSLSGSLPNHICGLLPRLEWLGLAINEFSGQVPLNLSHCSNLRYLDLSQNNFSGSYIPKEIGNARMLERLILERNNLKGVIPHELGNLYNLEAIVLEHNNLSGHIPEGIFNLSMIRILDLAANSLVDNLPSNTGFALPNLENLYLFQNHFSGVIPHSISNCSNLRIIELAANNFIGSIPESLGDVKNLELLNVEDNQFRSKSSSEDLSFFIFLSKCKKLKILSVSVNPLEGLLPVSIGNLSKSIEQIYASGCKIKGSIPSGIGNLSNLYALTLRGNQLIGSLPPSIKGLQDLQQLDLANNKLGGFVPTNLCGLQRLSELKLQGNQIIGTLPHCLGNISSLRKFHISSNRLTSSIPTSLWNLKDLLKLDLSSNYLSGPLPLKVGNLKTAIMMNLSRNSLSGDVPSTIGDMRSLEQLDLARNKLQGSIPESTGNILSLKYLDLSHNELSGLIPKSLERLEYLEYFNVSFNKLRGEIPSRGHFENFTSQSFIFNDALCGDPKFNVPPCPKMPSKRKQHYLMLLLLIAAPFLAVSILALIYVRHGKKDRVPNGTDSWPIITPERISYQQLLAATNGYDESNLLGKGSYGTVYKGILNGDRVLAIKVFDLGHERAFRSFEAECEVLCNVRHRNLTKVVSCCSNPDFKALILEFMPNGSLEKWLYSHNYFLDIMQRLNIVIDVACALQYLHFGNPVQIVHCDLKPSNVLLDQDMIAHVSDFGIAKLLNQEQSNAHTNTLATFGYIAPEYGLEGLVSTKSDVYSYGILLMEVFTRKKPNDEMFHDGLSLREWVNNLDANAFLEALDANLLKEGEEYYTEKLKCLSSIFKVALNCSTVSKKSTKYGRCPCGFTEDQNSTPSIL